MLFCFNVYYIFLKKKMVKFGSIKDTDLIFGWEMQSTTDFLPSIHTDLSVAVVSRTM